MFFAFRVCNDSHICLVPPPRNSELRILVHVWGLGFGSIQAWKAPVSSTPRGAIPCSAFSGPLKAFSPFRLGFGFVRSCVLVKIPGCSRALDAKGHKPWTPKPASDCGFPSGVTQPSWGCNAAAHLWPAAPDTVLRLGF